MSDWENSESEGEKAKAQPRVIAPAPAKTKWEGEDEEANGVASDWEESSDEDKPSQPKSAAAPPKKKGTLKQKLAQKEAEKSARIARGEFSDDEEAEMHPQERARLDKERELAADLKNAADLMGGASISQASSSGLEQLLSLNPKTKEDFAHLSSLIIEHILKRHESKPLYHAFIEHHVREISLPLKDLEVRKAASALTTLANEKQKEQKDKASGKKKGKTAPAKSSLAAAKVGGKIDTTAYEEALDDFGNDPNDFM